MKKYESAHVGWRRATRVLEVFQFESRNSPKADLQK